MAKKSKQLKAKALRKAAKKTIKLLGPTLLAFGAGVAGAASSGGLGQGAARAYQKLRGLVEGVVGGAGDGAGDGPKAEKRKEHLANGVASERAGARRREMTS